VSPRRTYDRGGLAPALGPGDSRDGLTRCPGACGALLAAWDGAHRCEDVLPKLEVRRSDGGLVDLLGENRNWKSAPSKQRRIAGQRLRRLAMVRRLRALDEVRR